MDKIWPYIFIALVIISGAFTLPTCINYLKAKSSEENRVSDVEKKQLPSTKDSYTITYDLDSGEISDANPTTYNLFTDSFTLNNPTKEGYEFLGWTGTDISSPQLKVTICKGSAGDLAFKANFRKISRLESTVISLSGNILSWNAIEHAETYILIVGSFSLRIPSSVTQYDLSLCKGYLYEGSNTIVVKATADGYIESFESNRIDLDIYRLSIPSVSLNGTIVSWNAIEHAESYTVVIGDHVVLTTDTSINLQDYSNLFSSGTTYIAVKATNSSFVYIDSDFSEFLENVSLT